MHRSRPSRSSACGAEAPPHKNPQNGLARTPKGVAEIASEVGYESESAFNRAVKREFGLPPAQYRREQRKISSAELPMRWIRMRVMAHSTWCALKRRSRCRCVTCRI